MLQIATIRFIARTLRHLVQSYARAQEICSAIKSAGPHQALLASKTP